MDNILNSYGDQSRKEDVMKLVEILTATETSIKNMIGMSKAIDAVHSTQIDTLDTAASAAVAENADYTAAALTTPTRLTNIVEKIAKPFSVSRTQQAIDHYHGENELTRQTTKKLKDFGNSCEFDVVRSTLVSGASGTVPKMSGIIEHTSKSTNHTSHTSGTAWSASIMKGLMKDNIDNSNGDVAQDIFMGSFLKDLTDGFTNKTNVVNTGLNIREIVTVVDVFETGLGKLKTHYHRYIQQSGDATGRVLAIRPEKHKLAWLIEAYIDRDLARTGPYDFYAVSGDLTLATQNQDSNFYADGFNIG